MSGRRWQVEGLGNVVLHVNKVMAKGVLVSLGDLTLYLNGTHLQYTTAIAVIGVQNVCSLPAGGNQLISLYKAVFACC